MGLEATTRRGLLSAAAVTTTAAAVSAAGAVSAAAATTYPPRAYTATRVPTATARHFLNRLGCGFSANSYTHIRRAGTAAAWFEAQLDPDGVAEPAVALALPSWFPDMADSAKAKWTANVSGVKGGWQYAADFAGYSMLRQVYSNRQVLENMVNFWSDHLHVPSSHDTAWTYRHSYDQVIRKHALGRFEDLLVECSLHPAMLLYLDNWTSVKGAPNENQGRELLELHTVGRAAGYTESMVKSSATILSGWTVDAFKTWEPSYATARHTTGRVQVLGFTAANDSVDGQELTREYLRYLAHHPATALNIARKLCRHLVADQPSDAVVTAVAKAFRESGTDIRTTLRALVAHPDFAASKGQLVRNPVQDFVATCRVLRVAAQKPTTEKSFARACVWVPNTTLLYQWPRPDGLPLGNAPWSTATRMLSSFRMHWSLTAGWWPSQDVTYRSSGAAWLPAASIRFDEWVDHLCRVLLGRTSDSRILTASVAATGYPPSTLVTKDHALATWLFTRLVGALLDSPDHMRR